MGDGSFFAGFFALGAIAWLAGILISIGVLYVVVFYIIVPAIGIIAPMF